MLSIGTNRAALSVRSGQLLASSPDRTAKLYQSFRSFRVDVKAPPLLHHDTPTTLGGQQPVMLRSAFYTGRKLPRSPRLGAVQTPQLVIRALRNEQVPKSNWAPT